MRIEDVEIHVGDLNRPYRVLGAVKVSEKAITAFSNSPKIESVNSKLREAAVKLGGNAVINVTYKRGISLTSWKALTATGTAVLADLGPVSWSSAAPNPSWTPTPQPSWTPTPAAAHTAESSGPPESAGATFCPRCGERRVGAFRFCRKCGLDFDASA